MILRVYIVEGSAIMVKLLTELMHGDGITVVGHSDRATTAIAEIATLRPDVVVNEIALREGNGFMVLKALWDRAGEKGPVRVVLTNYTLDPYRDAAKRLGVEYFFDKSNQIPEMLRVLRAMSHSERKANGAPT